MKYIRERKKKSTHTDTNKYIHMDINESQYGDAQTYAEQEIYKIYI